MPIVIQTGTTSCLAGFDSSSSSTSSSPHIGAIVGGVVGGLGGLALISILVWALIVRPARQAKSRQPGFYDEDEDHMSASTEPKAFPMSDTTRPLAPVGSYNISSIDYRAPVRGHCFASGLTLADAAARGAGAHALAALPVLTVRTDRGAGPHPHAPPVLSRRHVCTLARDLM